MKLDIKKVLPKDLSIFQGFRPIRLIAVLYMFVMVARSCVHLFDKRSPVLRRFSFKTRGTNQ